MAIDKSIFWNINETLTHSEALFFVITGTRGCGKSYGCKKRAIENFIKKGEQFGYIRRYEKDLDEAYKEFYKDIIDEFPDYEFKIEGRKFYCRIRPEDEKEKWTEDEVCGYAFVLSTASNKKSIPYPKITMLIYDEFMLDKVNSNQRYIPNEPISLLNLYETVARPGTGHPRVVLFLLGNNTSVNNPFWYFFDLQLPTKQDKNGKWIWKHPTKPIIVENAINPKFIEAKRATEFGAITAGTSYDAFSMDNKFINDSDTFIEKRSPNARFYFSFIYKGRRYGVWADFIAGLMWVSEKIDPGYPLVFSLTMQDHSPNTLFLKSRSGNIPFRKFIDAYQNGAVRFENQMIKSACYEIIKMVMNC